MNRLLTGEQKFPTALAKQLKQRADESFCQRIDVALTDLPIPPAGWKYHLDTAVGVKLKGYCDPHEDPFFGDGDPKSHRSVFWLLSDTSRRTSHLIANGQSASLQPNQWAFFDDADMHAFLADGTWIGLAVQLTEEA